MDYTKLINYNITIPKSVRDTCRNKELCLISSVIITNLLSCVGSGHVLSCALRNNSTKVDDLHFKCYTGKRKITGYLLRKAIDKLERLGYITVLKGSRTFMDGEWENKATQIYPTKLLIETFVKKKEIVVQAETSYRETLQTIILKNAQKEREGYKDTEEIKVMRELVHKLNETNAKHSFVLNNTALDNSKIVRIFNEDFNHGGRFYHSDTLAIPNSVKEDGEKKELPASQRRIGMKIDGEDVVEVDYRNLHCALLMDLYGCDKSRFAGDIYSSMISLDRLGNPNNRKLFKEAVNIAINSKDESTARRAIQNEINKSKNLYDYTNGQDVLSAIKQGLPEIAEFIAPPRGEGVEGRSTGSWLQRLDSEIASIVISVFVEQEKPIVPIHDSFLVKHSDLDLLVQSMAEAYRDVVRANTTEEYPDEWVEIIDVLMKVEFASGEKIDYKE